jgi:type II secretory pathway component PulC
MDNSSSAAWSTTPTPPVDREAAAVASLFTDTKPAPAAKTKATKATKNSKAKDVKIASVSAAGTPAGAAVPATAAPSPADGATSIAKADVNAALGNFSALAGAVRGSFSADGAHLDAVAPDSLFAKAGLQAGDTITAINNQPLRSLDDAATLYSRAGSMKSATIQVTRAGKPVSLHLAIQ